MKKSYKFTLILTFAVILTFILLMMLQGGVTEQHNTTLYVAFLALVNVYLWLCAYLYSPAVDSLDDIQFKEARREHEHIMNQFYEQELPDIKAAQKENKGPEKRRYMKKDRQEKAKEKLWESIIKETEGEESSEDSEDENQI